jgi:hypothetical protein
MRRTGFTVAALGLLIALLTAGCDPLDRQYLREGIGNDLYWSSLPEVTRLEDAYIGYVCEQAGLPTAVVGDSLQCAAAFGPGEWSLFFQAGMNDIDRRCDAYLAWLDDKRRNREPILKQISDMSTTAIGILRAANVGSTPITIVGLAFGLAADTFTNVSSRLLLEVDHSTVQAVVLGNQADFRAKNVNVAIDNRPAAIYLLRRYLRLCMPYAIEMSINSTITVYHRDPAGLAMTPILLRTPMAARQTAQALRESIPLGGPRGSLTGAGKTNPRPPDVEPRMEGATDAEKGIPQSIGERIQKNLCIVSPTTSFAQARDAIQQAKKGANRSRHPLFTNTDSKILNAAEVQLLLNATSPSCPADDGPQTPFEKFSFPDRAAVEAFQRNLKACDARLEVSGNFDPATRDAILVAKGKIDATKRVGLTDLATKTLRADSFFAIQAACR